MPWLLTLVLTLVLATQARAAEQPNVIVVVTDDQAAATMTAETMPAVQRVLVEGGTEFTSSVVSTPLCCPSRSVFLTGQYGHNNGVLWNAPGYRDLREKSNTLPVWMRRAGYLTVHVGKYLNAYRSAVDDPAEAAPGWMRWRTVLDPTSYYSAPFSDGRRLRQSGTSPAQHTTAIINREASRAIRRLGPRRRPLFMVVDHFAPHRSGGPSQVERCSAPGPEPLVADGEAFADAPLPRPASFNEADVADKPSFIRARGQYDAGEVAALERTWGCTLASLLGVDRGVAEIWRELGRIGERRNTVLAFTSDNGLYFGEHRLSVEKTAPYRESLEVPLALRLPPRLMPARRRGRPVAELVGNADLPATILDLAGAEPCRSSRDCRTLDGRSLRGLATGRGRWPGDRAIPLELDTGGEPADPFSPCAYRGLATLDEIYVHHTSAAGADRSCSPIDETERYDLGSDPLQLDNLAALDPIGDAALEARTARQARCAGIPGRDRRRAGVPFCE